MFAGQSQLVVLTVDGDVLSVSGTKTIDGFDDGFHAALAVLLGVTHLFGGEVDVHAGAVPVA